MRGFPLSPSLVLVPESGGRLGLPWGWVVGNGSHVHPNYLSRCQGIQLLLWNPHPAWLEVVSPDGTLHHLCPQEKIPFPVRGTSERGWASPGAGRLQANRGHCEEKPCFTPISHQTWRHVETKGPLRSRPQSLQPSPLPLTAPVWRYTKMQAPWSSQGEHRRGES